MEIGTPFIIDTADDIPQNHSFEETETAAASSFPFEFSRSRLWSESVTAAEIKGTENTFCLEKEIGEIKQLIADIKNVLNDIFELK